MISSDPGPFEVIVNDGRQSRIFCLDLGAASVGRGKENTVQLDDPNVSRRHARLVREGKRVWVEDLGSHNGVYVNNVRVSGRARVYSRDVLRIGGFSLELSAEDFRRRGEETTEPHVDRAKTRAEDAPAPKSRRRPDEPLSARKTPEEFDRTEVVSEEFDRTEVVSTPARGAPALIGSKRLASTRSSPPTWIFPLVPYLLVLSAILLSAVALVLVIGDPFDHPKIAKEKPQARVLHPTDSPSALALPAPPTPLSDAERLVAKAHEALDAGRFADAERLANAAAVLDPGNKDAEQIKAQLRTAAGP